MGEAYLEAYRACLALVVRDQSSSLYMCILLLVLLCSVSDLVRSGQAGARMLLLVHSRSFRTSTTSALCFSADLLLLTDHCFQAALLVSKVSKQYSRSCGSERQLHDLQAGQHNVRGSAEHDGVGSDAGKYGGHRADTKGVRAMQTSTQLSRKQLLALSIPTCHRQAHHKRN